jgi:RNA polymerase sigma-B factor
MDAQHLYQVQSLDAPAAHATDGGKLSDFIGTDDRDLARAEAREAIRPMLAELADRERRIVYLRYFEDRSQSEIAAIVGLSQMQVSRLLAASLGRMRSLATRPPSSR